jgi:hypothetical protein
MKNRLFKNWRTSILGLALLIGAGLFVWFGKATLTEAAASLPAALALMFVKDPQTYKKR